MATSVHTDTLPYGISSVAEDLTGCEGLVVTISTAGAVSLCNVTNQATTETTFPFGVVLAGCTTSTPQTLDLCTRPGSMVKVIAAETVVRGDPGMVTYNASTPARMGNRTGNTLAAGDWICGYFLEGGSAGDLLDFMWLPYPFAVAT